MGRNGLLGLSALESKPAVFRQVFLCEGSLLTHSVEKQGTLNIFSLKTAKFKYSVSSLVGLLLSIFRMHGQKLNNTSERRILLLDNSPDHPVDLLSVIRSGPAAFNNERKGNLRS